MTRVRKGWREKPKMRHNCVFGLALLLLAASPLMGGQAVGIVLNVEGEASLGRDGQSRPLLLGDTLMAGDQLKLEKGSASFVFCPTSERVSLDAKGTLELAEDSLRVVDGASPSRKATRRCSLPKVALGDESTERIGGLVARGLPPIPLYLGGAVASVRPSFAWEAVEGNPQYEISVRDQTGSVVWEAATESTLVTYPEEHAELKPGKYHWEVVARINGETVAQQSARFQIKPNPELAGLQPEDPADRLLSAIELENAGYLSEASAWIRALREENPKDIRFTQRLMLLYWNAGLIPAANLERERLEKLQGSKSD